MVDVDFLALDGFVRQKLSNAADYSEVISLCVGIGVSRLLPIPSTELENPEYHWDYTMRYEAINYITIFNNNIPINTDEALDIARSFWMIRHRSAYPLITMTAEAGASCSFVGNYVSESDYLSQAMQKRLNKNISPISIISSRVANLIKVKRTQM